MRKLLLIVSSILLIVGITGCMSGKAASPEGKKISALLDKADIKRKIASKEGVEFRFTKNYIKQGRTALEKGNLKKAKHLANRALTEALRAVEQKKITNKNWKIAIPK